MGKGDWLAAAKVAVWPTALLLVLAGVAAMFFADDAHSGGLGWGVRMRIALALLLQSVGGGVAISGNMSESFGPFGGRLAGEATLSLVPLVVTAAWAGVLVFAARRVLRPAALSSGTVPMPSGTAPGMGGTAGVASRTGAVSGSGAGSGPGVVEAVLRVAVLCGAGSFVLGLLAQPSYDGVELSSAPFLSLLWSFLLAAVVGGVAMARAEAGAWLAARPAWQLAVGALRTALFALLTVVTLAGIVTVVTMLATAKQDISGGAVVAMLVLLPNIGALALAMAWGAPLNAEWTLPDIPFLDPSGRQSIGYGELGDQGGGWLFGVIVGGLVCALLVGFLVVRRSADRREQLLSAGLFVVSLMALVLVAGASASAAFRAGGGYGYGGGYGEGYGGYGSGYGGGESLGAHGEIAVGGAETLLFALLWVFGAVLVVSYLRRMTGAAGAPQMPLMPPTPPMAPTPPTPPTPSTPSTPSTPPMVPGPDVAPVLDVAPGAAAFAPAPTAGPAPVPSPAEGGAPVQSPAAGGDQAPPSVPPTSVPPTSVPPTDAPLTSAPPAAAPPTDASAAAPAEARSRPRAVTWVALALAAFLVGGGATAGGLYFLAHRDSGSHDTGNHKEAGGRGNTGDPKDADNPKSDSADKAGGPSASASPSPSPAPTTTGDPAGGPTPGATAGLPDGFVQKYDPYGFSLAVKSDWTRSVKGTQVDYTAPVGKQYLRIGVIAHAPTSSYGNFENLEKGAKKRTNYQRVELKKNTFAHRPGARWEFTYVNDTGNTVHAVDQAYVAEDGTEYSVYYECLDVLYDPENDKVFSTALSTWSVSDVDVD
ncbi:hypothetical protein [Streptomyces endophytica]|uniref:Serine/threonine protein kinase n=1 Tax=Streptomyces endophytica TaxID=2991496 RepID=A0ABY6PBA0_9ACTN|nr:hypothetical protein [Streptomyces endophytica]UZJ30755.1 hypothetical protein OJ254_10845 [Streptomyces endophytica]